MIATKLAVAQAAPRNNGNGALLVRHLHKQVANAFLLYANYKHYHWQTFGPLFRDLHLLFDEFANSVLATADEFAERLRMMGENPISDYRAMLDMSRIKPSRPGETMKQMVKEAGDNLPPLISDMRDAARRPTMTMTPAQQTCFQGPSSFMRSMSGFSARFWRRKMA